MSEASHILAVQSLTKRYDQVVAVNNVSFALRSGELTALAGGNGSGKSTLLRLIAGVTLPAAGEILWEGIQIPLGNVQEARKRGIELIHQDCALCPDGTVLENLFLGREPISPLGFIRRATMRNLASQLIDRYELPLPGFQLKARELSGGQQKVVAIGRALLSKPQLLLLDEPTAALGVKEREVILRALEELHASGVSILFCTHSGDEIFRLASRVVFLRRGELFADLNLPGPSEADVALLMSS